MKQHCDTCTCPADVVELRPGQDLYVLAKSTRRAREWALTEHPDKRARVFRTDSELGPRGMMLERQTVVCLDPLSDSVRQIWLSTGCRLVYV